MSPFRVLGVSTAATRPEVERAAQKLLALCAVRAAPTVDGVPLTEDIVREALAMLRDPRSRLEAELTALASGSTHPIAPPTALGTWLGWGGAAPRPTRR